MIRHVSEAHNHEFYSHFLLFSTTTKVPTIVQMPKAIKANSKAIRKSVEKAKNIQLAVQAYKDPSSGLSLRAAALLYGCNKDSITNHLNDTPKTSQIRYAPDVYVERQLLNAAEETALCSHILDVELLHHHANELLQARLGPPITSALLFLALSLPRSLTFLMTHLFQSIRHIPLTIIV
jgi:hypothetical protein